VNESTKVGALAKFPSSRKGKWVVVALWVVAFMALAPLAGSLTKVQDNQVSSWLPGDAEATQVLEVTERFRSNDEFIAIVVYEKAAGLTQADLSAIGDQIDRFSGLESVKSDVVGPITSAEQPSPQAAQVVVPLNVGRGTEGFNELPDAVEEVRDIAGSGVDGLSVHVTGPAGTAADQVTAFGGTEGTLLMATVLVVIVLLLLTYRSPVMWLLPVISVGIALMAAQGLIYVMAKNGLTVNAQSAGILAVLVFGAGTDYALLLIARYREELRKHEDKHRAMAIALNRAGPAIFASAATVIIGMLCLSFADLNSTAGLGPVAAVGIAVGLLAMVSLLPALLLIFGRWVFWPARPNYGSSVAAKTGLWDRVGSAVARKPRFTWVATAIVLGVLALGSLNLTANGLTNAAGFTNKPDSVVGAEILGAHFPAGSGQPVQVVASADKADEVADVLADVPGIDSVSEPVVRDGFVYLEGISTAAPDSDEAVATLNRVRDAVHQVPDANALAGGQTALLADTAAANSHDRKLVIPIMLAVVFLILAGLLRSIVAPVLLLGTVVLSFLATMGISAFFFENVFGFEGADGAFPLLVFVFLVALGIDYNIFLMTRVHEESKLVGTRRGALTGLSTTGGVITSAGLVLAGTFAVFIALPLTHFVQLGFAVAVGVLIDAIIIRAVLVTALTLDVGRWMWWPSKLAQKHDVVEAPAAVDPAPEHAVRV